MWKKSHLQKIKVAIILGVLKTQSSVHGNGQHDFLNQPNLTLGCESSSNPTFIRDLTVMLIKPNRILFKFYRIMDGMVHFHIIFHLTSQIWLGLTLKWQVVCLHISSANGSPGEWYNSTRYNLKALSCIPAYLNPPISQFLHINFYEIWWC